MLLQNFLTELKVYLDIKETDVEKDGVLTQAINLASGYVAANCSYYLLDETLIKEEYLTEATDKFYLDAGPSTGVTVFLNDVEVTDNTTKIINNVVYLGTAIGVSGDLVKLEYTVGIDETTVKHSGDLAQATALAAYFFKQADKGLDGVMQYGTGIKESARLYEGIPRAIIQYFETKKVFRF